MKKKTKNKIKYKIVSHCNCYKGKSSKLGIRHTFDSKIQSPALDVRKPKLQKAQKFAKSAFLRASNIFRKKSAQFSQRLHFCVLNFLSLESKQRVLAFSHREMRDRREGEGGVVKKKEKKSAKAKSTSPYTCRMSSLFNTVRRIYKGCGGC